MAEEKEEGGFYGNVVPSGDEKSEARPPTTLRQFIREEHKTLVDTIRDIVKREIAEASRETRREIADLKKIVS